jgi:TPR repeat protein
VLGHDNIADHHEAVALACLFQKREEAIAAARAAQKRQSSVAGAGDKVQVVSAVGAMQAAGHDKQHGIGSIVPALAQNARTGHPEFQNGTEKQGLKGWATRPNGHPTLAPPGGKRMAEIKANWWIRRLNGNCAEPAKTQFDLVPKTAGASISARSVYAEAVRLFRPGQSVKEYRSGFALMKSAAAMGYIKAHEWLGAMYDYGLGTRPNRRLSLRHYRIAADAGSPNGEYHVGVFYHDGIAVRRDDKTAVLWLRKAMRHGDAEAAHVLGQCYRSGRGVRKNPKKGFALEFAAAKRKVLEAQFSLGICYSRGEGVPANLRQAFKWYLIAAKRGHKDAAHNLAYFYETGRGVRENKKKAEFWYGRAKD